MRQLSKWVKEFWEFVYSSYYYFDLLWNEKQGSERYNSQMPLMI